MEILELTIVGFVVIMLGSFFLFGELFVKAKGLFFLIGVALFTTYFFYFITNNSMLWLAIVFILGLSLVAVDGALLNDGTLTMIGLGVMSLSVAVPAPTFLYGFVAVFGLIAGFGLSLTLLKVFQPRNMWSRMALKDRLSSEEGYNSMNEEYVHLLGKEGVAATVFRPIGNVEIEGKTYSAVTEGQWLEKGVSVSVISVDGTKIVVKQKSEG